MKKPVVYAHRGASKYAPENTMAAFRLAVEMKSGGIELDTHLTKDGHLVVTHDARLGRTCNGRGLIKDLDFEYLKSLDFGSWFSAEYKDERIPLLSDVMELICGKDMILNVEIKASPGQYAEGIERKVAGLIRDYRMEKSVIVSSFNHYSLLRLKEEAPDIMTAPLYSGVFANVWLYARGIGAGAVHPYCGDVTAEIVQGCKANGILVNTWTVDREEDIRKMAAYEVDGIITNVPDVVLRLLDSNTD